MIRVHGGGEDGEDGEDGKDACGEGGFWLGLGGVDCNITQYLACLNLAY